jgi:hypothetical protein
MDRARLLELAIAELERQKAGIDEDIAAIRAEMNGPESAELPMELAPSAGNRKKRTAAERRAQAKRMREYWAARRAQAVKPAASAPKTSSAPARTGRVRVWTDAEKKALSLKLKKAWEKRKAASAKKAKAKT